MWIYVNMQSAQWSCAQGNKTWAKHGRRREHGKIRVAPFFKCMARGRGLESIGKKNTRKSNGKHIFALLSRALPPPPCFPSFPRAHVNICSGNIGTCSLLFLSPSLSHSLRWMYIFSPNIKAHVAYSAIYLRVRVLGDWFSHPLPSLLHFNFTRILPLPLSLSLYCSLLYSPLKTRAAESSTKKFFLIASFGLLKENVISWNGKRSWPRRSKGYVVRFSKFISSQSLSKIYIRDGWQWLCRNGFNV